jgi:alpha-glucosidase (family GH31 glycosyl hydrolase)
LNNQFTVTDSSDKWGLGERFQDRFKVTNGHWTIWNRDKPWKIDQGLQGLSDQTYGHQPVYLAKERASGLYHLVYFKNTFGILLDIVKNSDEINYHSVGGNIHFVIILGQSDPEDVLERYHEYIGRGHIPPFWSLGFHQCRWGYRDTNALR